MVSATYKWEVDWNGNGVFGDANEDITNDVLRCEWQLGRDYASMLTGRARGGKMLITLDNHTNDGKYSSFNTSSPLSGNILPGRKVRLQATDASGTVTIWQGFLDRINPQVAVGAARTALLEAIGPLAYLGQPWHEIFVPMSTNQLTGTLLGALLDAVSWPAADRDIDAGNTTIRRATFGTRQQKLSVLEAMHRVEEAENGFLHESTDGKVIFEDRKRRLGGAYLTSQVTVSDSPGAGEITYSGIAQGDPLKQIFNTFQSNAQRYAVGAVAVIWTLDETGADSPGLRVGESRTFVADMLVDEDSNVGVDTWTTPVATTDYIANSAADGSGTDLTASIGVAVTKLGTRMLITLTNNHASSIAYITKLQGRGTPISRREPVWVYAEDSASQSRYGRRVYSVPSELVQNSQEAQDHVKALLTLYKDPRPTVSLRIFANRDADHLSHVLRRRVSDRITVKATGSRTQLGINRAFYIEAQRHLVLPGKLHEVTWECSPIGTRDSISGETPWWVLGTGALDDTTALFY